MMLRLNKNNYNQQLCISANDKWSLRWDVSLPSIFKQKKSVFYF